MRDDWTVTTIGAVTTHFRGTVKVEDGVSYPASGVMMEGRGLIDREPFIGGISGYKKLTPITAGQLVLRSITAWEAPITVVPVGYIGRHVSGVFPVLNLDEGQVNPGFMRLICQWPVFWNEMRMRATGSVLRRKTLSASQLQQIPINLPPLVEQKRIMDVVSSVDTYIDALQQQAVSARVARNAVLHELLLVGGDDWTETTLGDIAKCAGGTGFPHAFQGGETGTPFVKVSDMNESGNELFLNSSKNYLSKEAIKSLGARVWPTGTVVFAKVGAALLTEKRRILVQDTIFDNNIMGLVPKASIESHFLYLFMETVKLGDYVQPGAVPSINNSIVSEIAINLPPLDEQKRIVEIVSSMDEVVQSTEQAVVDAKNLRSGLLSDLLSGEHEIPKEYDQFLRAA